MISFLLYIPLPYLYDAHMCRVSMLEHRPGDDVTLCLTPLRSLTAHPELNIFDKAGWPVSSKDLPVYTDLSTGVPDTASCLAFTWVMSIPPGSSCLDSKSSYQLSHLPSLLIIFFKNKSKLPRCAQVLLIYYNKSLWSVPKTSIVTDPLYTKSSHCKT